MFVVSVDPGLRHCGVAIWKDGELAGALLSRNQEKKARGAVCWVGMASEVYNDVTSVLSQPSFGGEIDALVIEYPQVYATRFQKGDQMDLIELAAVAGAVQAEFVGVNERVSYLPKDWKGQVPKEIHNARVEAKLSDAEKRRIQALPASLRHNVIDGIGIGLFFLTERGYRK